MYGIHAAFTGRVGQNAEQRFTQKGTPFLSFSVAVSDQKTDERVSTEWVRVMLFDEARVAALGERITKGIEVYVEGRLRMNIWEAADGARRSGLQLSAWTVQPMGQIGQRAASARPEADGLDSIPF